MVISAGIAVRYSTIIRIVMYEFSLIWGIILTKYIHEKSELLIIFVIFIISYLKDFSNSCFVSDILFRGLAPPLVDF